MVHVDNFGWLIAGKICNLCCPNVNRNSSSVLKETVGLILLVIIYSMLLKIEQHWITIL